VVDVSDFEMILISSKFNENILVDEL